MRMERQVIRFAAASRACVSLLAALSAWLVPPYDTSSQLLAGGGDGSGGASLAAAFGNWDGVYFAHIARAGYEYEHFHAFFPLYPALVRLVSLAIPAETASAVLLSGWIVSNASFVAAALFLYRLGLLVLRDERVARRAAYLFCIVPSSIFMSAVYSESLMCLLSFGGMYFLEKDAARADAKPRLLTTDLLLSAAAFGASSLARSNGVLLSLYIAWRRLRVSPSPAADLGGFLAFWACTAVLGVVAVGPQVVYFLAAATRYCPSLFDSAPAGQADRPWCADVVPNISAMYMFIQKEYWNVGLLRYYELRQLPNFLLASPVIALSAHSLASFFSQLLRRSPMKQPVPPARVGSSLAPYYVHWLFLLVNALLVVHIQVTTRLLAACPPLFWHPAAVISEAASRGGTRYRDVVVGYFLLFTVLGGVLFPTFYPWT